MLHNIRFGYFSISLSLCFILTHTISNSFRGTIGVELNQPTRGVSHFRNIVDPAVDASFECKKEKVSIAWLKHRWHSLGLRNLLLKITHLYAAKDSICLSKKHNSPRIEDWAWIIEQLRFLLNQEWRELSQGNPASFLWKSYTCWGCLGFVIFTLIYLVERLYMLQWQQATETFIGFETEQDRMCYKTRSNW